jgi:recombination protein RecA
MAKSVKIKDEDQDKKDPLTEAIKRLETKYGIGTIVYGKDVKEDLEIVPTGSLNLDIATNLGGNPVGKLIEIFGPESSGKSTLCLHMTGGFQQLDGECALIDFEHSYDKNYATKLGVDVDKLIIIQPDCLEDGYNIVESLIRTGRLRFVIMDSHTAGQTKKVIEGEVGEATVASQARVNSVGLSKIKPLLKPNRCTMIGVSQLRADIGGYGGDKPTGGNAWKFYSDIRYKVFKINDKDNESNKTTVEVIKNKCAPPFGKAEFRINWGTGIDRIREIVENAIEFEMIKLGGAGWYTIGETKMQGMDKVKEFLTDNPEYALQLEKDVLSKIKREV